MTSNTPDQVAKLATESVHLDKTALLGIYGPANKLQALLRLQGGQIVRVSAGDTVGRTTVTAISAEAIALNQKGRNVVLRLP